MQGTTKKMPGPLAPPFLRRPRRKMTARSYSFTTCREEGEEEHLHTEEEGEGEGGEAAEDGEEGDEECHAPRRVRAT